MVPSMPEIFIANIDEAFYKDDIAILPHELVRKVKSLFPRFLFCLGADDVIVVSSHISREFLDYFIKLNNLKGRKGIVIEMPDEKGLGQLVKLILKSGHTLDLFRTLSRYADFKIEPFIETPLTVELSELIDIPLKRTAPQFILNGVITKLNNKVFFKKIAQKLGISTVPGYVAGNYDDMLRYIKKAANENGGKVMLKNPYHAGGIGNFAGSYPGIINELPKWFKEGEIIEIIIEHFIDFHSIAGSLVHISDDGCEFIGIDEQMSEGGKWSGFSYPCALSEISGDVEKMSMDFALEAYKMGARGELNIDWGVVKNAEGCLKPLALESNFRHNGFGIILNYVKRYFGSYQKHLIYSEIVPVSPGIDSFEKVLTLLAPYLIDRPGMREGVLMISPPNEGKCALAAVADDKARAVEFYENAKRRLV